MRANGLREIWATGKSANNCWLSIPSPYVTEAIAGQGWDSVTIDMQHGMIGISDAYAMLTAVSTTDCTPIVRVPWNDPAIIMKALDAGAYGIICPMVNTREECEAFVGACLYAPVGYRSVGPNRAALYGGPDYLVMANETILSFAMIETGEALDDLEGICSVPGLDGVLIGPADLGLSLGRKPQANQTDEVVVEAIEHVLQVARAHNLRTAIFNSNTDYANQMSAKGFDLVTVTSDMGLVRQGAAILRQVEQ